MLLKSKNCCKKKKQDQNFRHPGNLYGCVKSRALGLRITANCRCRQTAQFCPIMAKFTPKISSGPSLCLRHLGLKDSRVTAQAAARVKSGRSRRRAEEENAWGAAVHRVPSATAPCAARKRARTEYNQCIHCRCIIQSLSSSRPQGMEAAVAFCLR